MNDFLAHFVDQFEETDPSEINLQTSFHELDEWSSLIGLSVLAMIDEEYNVILKGRDLKSAHTVEDLYKIVVLKMKGNN